MSRSRGIGPLLEMRWGTWGSSRVVVGNSGFLSNFNGYFAEPLELHKGSQASFQIERGMWALSSIMAGESGLISVEGGIRWISRFSVGRAGFLSSCYRDLSEPLVLLQVSQISFRVVSVTLGF